MREAIKYIYIYIYNVYVDNALKGMGPKRAVKGGGAQKAPLRDGDGAQNGV